MFINVSDLPAINNAIAAVQEGYSSTMHIFLWLGLAATVAFVIALCAQGTSDDGKVIAALVATFILSLVFYAIYIGYYYDNIAIRTDPLGWLLNNISK